MRAESEPRNISTGDIAINFRDRVYNLDLLLLRMTIEEAERISPPRRDGDTLMPTAEFLKTLARQLETELGITGITPTAAYQIWIESSNAFAGLKKSTD